MQTRILIVLNAGAFQGASITGDNGSPAPLDEAALADLFPDLNVASLARIAELETALPAATERVAALEDELAGVREAALSEIARLEAALAAATAPPEIGSISKLTLKRRLDALGKWSAFKAFLTALGEAAVDEFNLAAEIRADDPMFQQIAPLAKQALDLTDEQYTALLSAG